LHFYRASRCCADHNEDGIITKEEFLTLPRGEVDDMARGEESNAVWLNERRKEFEEVIDLDKDGKVGLEELKVILVRVVHFRVK